MRKYILKEKLSILSLSLPHRTVVLNPHTAAACTAVPTTDLQDFQLCISDFLSIEEVDVFELAAADAVRRRRQTGGPLPLLFVAQMAQVQVVHLGVENIQHLANVAYAVQQGKEAERHQEGVDKFGL